MGEFFLALSIVFNSVANGFFKAAADIQGFPLRKGSLLAIGLLVGLANTVCYIKALEKMQVGIAFPVFSSASIVLIALISLLYFHEAISIQKWIGMAVIVLGLLMVWKS
jgi:multidrug transporter EmrE-like cation transporter